MIGMATTKPQDDATSQPASTDSDAPVDLSGRLVLATGRVVAVPAEGVAVATEHFDDELGATVPVRDRFLLKD